MRRGCLVFVAACGRIGFGSGEPGDGGGSADSLVDSPWQASPPQQVSGTGLQGRGPSLVWADTVYAVAYHQAIAPQNVYFARFGLDGQLVGVTTAVSGGAAVALDPSLVWTGTDYAVVWHDRRSSSTDLYGAKLDVNGVKVGGDIPMVTPNSTDESIPSALVTPIGVAVVYSALSANSTVQLATFDRQLVPTGIDVLVASTFDGSHRKLASFGGDYAVVWTEAVTMVSEEVRFARFDSLGARLGTDVSASSLPTAANLALVATDSGYSVAWSQGMTRLLHVTRLDRNGAVIGETAIATGEYPALVWTGSSFGLSWHVGAPFGPTYFAELDASGALLAAPVQVTSRVDTPLAFSSIAWDGEGFGIAWEENFPDAENDRDGIYYSRVIRR